MTKLRTWAGSLVVGTILCGFTATALGQGATPAAVKTSGLVLGVRTGFGLPFGKTTDDGPDTAMSEGLNGMVPLWLDVGFRFDPHFQIGAFLQYGFVLLNEKDSFAACKANGLSCSGENLVVGLTGQYHLALDTVDPWVGIGVGYERLGFTISGQGGEVSATLSGFNFINLQAGADFAVTPQLGLGPFFSFSMGQYSSTEGSASNGESLMVRDPQKKAFHEWLVVGVRGVFNL